MLVLCVGSALALVTPFGKDTKIIELKNLM